MKYDFIITASPGSEYLIVRVGTIDVSIKMDEEGVAVDLFPFHVVDEPLASCWATYSEALDQD